MARNEMQMETKDLRLRTEACWVAGLTIGSVLGRGWAKTAADYLVMLVKVP
jgi:hypothetical protein